MMRELHSRGIQVNPAVFTVEEALEEILRVKLMIEKEKAEKERAEKQTEK